MKRSILAVIFTVIVLLPSCASGSGVADQTNDVSSASSESIEQVTATETESTDEDDRTLRDIAPSAVEAGNFDDLALVYNDDDYASDLLEFSYGIEADLASKIASFVLTENTSNNSYTFAYFKFTSDATKDDIAAVKTAIDEVYVSNLKASLRTYNPEAYALCDEAVYKEYAGSLLFVICEKDAIDAVIAAVEG